MPNFKIQRQIETSDDYGCNTFFSTNQIVGDMASLVDGDPLDGSIIWYLDADPGYTVDVMDFYIPGTTATPVPQIAGSYRTFEGSGIPAPVLGVVFDQVTVTQIKITLYLHPIALHGITGPVFVMPSNSVNISINIEGCAERIAEGLNINVVNGDEENTTVTVEISEELEATLSTEELSGGEIHISGTIPNDKEDKELFRYTIEPKEGG